MNKFRTTKFLDQKIVLTDGVEPPSHEYKSCILTVKRSERVSCSNLTELRALKRRSKSAYEVILLSYRSLLQETL